MTLSDEELVIRTMAGNRASFGKLYDRYAPLVRGIAFETTGNINDAQDLAQEVFVQAFTKLHLLRDPARFGAWIAGITRLRGKQWLRSRSRDRHEFLGDSVEEALDGKHRPLDEFRDLHTAIMELEEPERIALHLFYFDKRPARQARTLMALSLSGFYRVLERAREKIRTRLSQDEEAAR